MAATNYTPISLYYSTTAAAAPTAGNLVNGELAINITDGKLYYKDNLGAVKVIAGAGGAGVAGGSNTQVQYNSSGSLAGSANMTFDGTTLTVNGLSTTGTVTLGDASGDALTINSSAVSIPNGLNFDSNTLVIDATNNNIGIGTSTFSYSSAGRGLLEINGSSNALCAFKVGNTAYGYLASSASVFELAAVGASQPIAFTTNSSERMRITSTGNVGIGTSSPGGKLEVAATDPSTYITRYVNAVGGANIYLQHSRGGSVGTNTIVQSGDTLGTIVFNGANGTGFSDAAYIQGAVDGTPGASADMPGRLMFLTSADGSATPTERMRIDSSGNVGIGTSSPNFPLNIYSSSAQIAIQNATTGSAAGDGSRFQLLGADLAIVNREAASIQFYTSDTERMRLDSSGNLGLGVTPSAWDGAFKVLDVAGGGAVFGYTSGALGTTSNAYYSSTGWKYKATGAASQYQNALGAHYWYTAASGTAGNAITFTQAMTLDASGNLLVGDTSSSYRLKARSDSVSGANQDIVQIYNGASSTASASIVFGTGAYSTTCRITGATTGANNGALVFGTDGGSGITERMRIDSSGNALFAKAVRATITTDNDLSFDMNAASNFKCTPSAGGALTFTNITSGQTGNIILVNGSNYAITAAATTKVSATCLATISATGTYWLSYYSDGTNVYVANTGALA